MPERGSSRCSPGHGTVCHSTTKAAGPCCLEPQKPRRAPRSTLILSRAPSCPATPDPLPHPANLSRLLTSRCSPSAPAYNVSSAHACGPAPRAVPRPQKLRLCRLDPTPLSAGPPNHNDPATAPGARPPKSGPTGHHWGDSRPGRQVRKRWAGLREGRSFGWPTQGRSAG